MKRLAVILPICCKDNTHFMRLAIESILNQEYSDFDLIITLDGAIDIEKEKLLLELYSSRIIINRSPINKGLAAVLNDSINYCISENYDYIARMDADDISPKNRFRNQISYLEENPLCDMLGTEASIINEKGQRIGYKKLPHRINISNLLWRCNIIHPSVIFRTKFFIKFGTYNVDYKKSQDYELWMRAAKMGAVITNLNNDFFILRYDSSIAKRRKNEQKYNIKLKLKHLPFRVKFFSIIPNVIIFLLPSKLLIYFSKKILELN